MVAATSYGPPATPLRYVQSTGDSQTRHTELNDILAGAGHVYLGKGVYNIGGNLDLQSNTRLQLHPGAVLMRDPSMSPQTQMIRMTSVSNVIVEGGIIDGNKANGSSGHGQAAGLTTNFSSFITIRDLEVRNWPADITGGSYGYGIYLGGNNSNILVSNVYAHDCNQNNMFLVGGTNIIIENSFFKDAQGSTPGSGLDIEPNSSSEIIQNLIVRNCTFQGNNYGVTCNDHYGGYWHDITFDGCVFQNNRFGGISITGGNTPTNTRLRNCVSRHNYGDIGYYLAGIVDLSVEGCQAYGNGGAGFQLISNHGVTMRGCSARNNNGSGYAISDVTAQAQIFDFGANLAFNNAGYGVQFQNGGQGTLVPPMVNFADCRTGNDALLLEPAWPVSTQVYLDFRVTNGGRIYECTTPGTTASSGGPSGTGSAINDGSAVWKHVMATPVQTWGFALDGRSTRGCTFDRNQNCGNTVGHIREAPQGDDNVLFTSDVIGTQFDGQQASAMVRTRSVAMENKVSTPGNVGTYYSGGRAAIAAAASSMTITTPFASVGDMVHVTQESPDATLKNLYAKVTAPTVITVQGDAAATAAVPFAWELVKVGSFPYDL